MGVGVIDSTLDTTEISIEDIFEADDEVTTGGYIDARRRLEDRIEEMRLQRELSDLDYDI